VTSLSEHPLVAFGEVGAVLLRTLASERVSPSYLFEGMDPETLLEGALAFAAGVLAGSPPKPADTRIFELAQAGTHPDLHILTKDKATVISVKALKPVLERAHTTPLECDHQVFIVHPAEAMDPEGIARYLKTLEEPPTGTVFILLSTRPERLPDTVLSRCRRTRFPSLGDESLAKRLVQDGLPQDEAQAACRHAGGSLVRARRMTECGVVSIAMDLARAAADDLPRVEQAAADALAHLQREATRMAAEDTTETDTKRQHVRALLGDVLRVLCVEARDRAADRPSPLLGEVPVPMALSLLTKWGALDAAVAANVTPSAVLIETAAVLRREMQP
jgi:hypothetical protein